MPILAPELSPELVLPPLVPPDVVTEVVRGTRVVDVISLPLDVKTVTELLLNVESDVEGAEFDAPEELPPAPPVVEAGFCDGAAEPEAREELG